MCTQLSAQENSKDRLKEETNLDISMKMRFTASLCRELLKLGKTKQERMIGREYLQLILCQNLEAWISDESVSKIIIVEVFKH
jgi:hypothetical protein